MSPTFAAITACERGLPHFNELRKAAANRPIEALGARLRGLMPSLGGQSLVDEPTR
jgi:hypothetical protein